ncbi:hypothetical protein [Actinoplanes sp. NPDC049599]|uniref:hypothetical protein n=1 Tax=Actinoplanes sp. NPDC049599 TaxID=3363903 RepID=UPI00378C4E82
MHGLPEAGPTDGTAAAPPPDWPAPGTPLPGEEPTIELPVVTAAMLAEHPPAAAEHPLITAGHPLVTAEHPPVTAEHPLVTAEHPPATAGHPLVTAEHPPVTAGHPLVTAEHPPVTAEHPLVTAEHPPVTAEHPPMPARQEPAAARPARSAWARRIPALERRGPRPAPAPARTVALDDLLDPPGDPADTAGRIHPAFLNPAFLGPATGADQNRPAGTDQARPGGTDQARPAGADQAPPAGADRTQSGDADSALPGGTDQSRFSGTGQVWPAAADEPGRRWTVGAGIAAAALLLTGATVVALTHDRGSDAGGSAGWSPPVAAAPGAPAAGHTVTAALDGRTSAGFDLVDGAVRVTLRTADLGGDLYRISTPAAGAARPRAEDRDGRVRLRLDGDAQAVDITLHAAVRWDLRVAGGAELSTIDLSAGRVGGVALTGGASRIELALPRPDGTLAVLMSGGVSSFAVRTAGPVPVRVRVGRGAGQVTLNGQRHAGVAAGRTFTPAAWAGAVDRIDVDAVAGMAALTVAPY